VTLSELPPFPGLVKIDTMKDGTPVYARRYVGRAEDAAEAPERPRYVYRGEQSPTLCYGELRRRNEDFFHDGQPIDERCEPMNDAAREVVAHYQLHRANPKLPRTAWDAIRGCLNTIEKSAPQTSVELRPR
jgi:sarcosine oxidase delta subunit